MARFTQLFSPDPLLLDAQRACCTRSGSWAMGTSLHRLGRVGSSVVRGTMSYKGVWRVLSGIAVPFCVPKEFIAIYVFDCLSWLCFTDRGDVLESRCQRLWWEAGGFWNYWPLSMLLRLNNQGGPSPFLLFGLSSNFAFIVIEALLYWEYTNRIYMSFERRWYRKANYPCDPHFCFA